MKMIDKIWRSNFLIKLRSWEYWPFNVIYGPIFIYWLWLSIRARSLLYFTASNPGIKNGGMLGESKNEILNQIPSQYRPKHLLFSPETDLDTIVAALKRHDIEFPFICKPDVGERGWQVEKICALEALKSYVNAIKVPFLVQQFIDLPIELGVFYYRYPNAEKGEISSIVKKEMLSITGDGIHTIENLILQNDRAKLQWKTLKEKFSPQLQVILKPEEKLQLVGIGNHCKGTKFINGNPLINDQLVDVFDHISHQINGFYFGRFDLRVASLEDLYRGKIQVMELNGAGSEAAHIYEPGFSLIEAYKSIFHHWKVLFKISIINHKKGVPYLSFKDGWSEYKRIKAISE